MEQKGLACRQLGVMLKRQLLTKMRARRQTLCELFSPLIFIALLVVGWSVSLDSIEERPAYIYANQTLDFSPILELAESLSGLSPGIGPGVGPGAGAGNGTVPLPGNGTLPGPGGGPSQGLPRWMVFAIGETLFGTIGNYTGPTPLINFDLYVGAHRYCACLPLRCC